MANETLPPDMTMAEGARQFLDAADMRVKVIRGMDGTPLVETVWSVAKMLDMTKPQTAMLLTTCGYAKCLLDHGLYPEPAQEPAQEPPT